LRIFRQQLERQAMQFLRTFNAYFPSDFTQQAPQGGYSIWGQLPNHVDTKTFYETCQMMGIGFTPGETFSFTDVYKRYFRAIFAQRLTTTDLSLIKQLGEELK